MNTKREKLDSKILEATMEAIKVTESIRAISFAITNTKNLVKRAKEKTAEALIRANVATEVEKKVAEKELSTITVEAMILEMEVKVLEEGEEWAMQNLKKITMEIVKDRIELKKELANICREYLTEEVTNKIKL